MGLSIIIPSKTFSNLKACVEAAVDADPGHRIIIVDDGLSESGYHPDSTDYDLGGCLDGCDIIPGQKPFIFSRNINLGIKFASGYDAVRRAAGDDDVVLLNDDALLQSPGGFSLLQREAEAHPEYGIIGATTNVTGQPAQWQQNVGLREVPHIAFVCVFISRRTINAVGLLDERYCIDYGVEDLDYCTAVTRAGLKVGVHDGCFVDHGSLVSSFRGDPRTPKDFSRNLALYREKWGL